MGLTSSQHPVSCRTSSGHRGRRGQPTGKGMRSREGSVVRVGLYQSRGEARAPGGALVEIVTRLDPMAA